MKYAVAALAAVLTFACRTAPPPAAAAPVVVTPAAAIQPCNPGHTILNATLWVQSAAEYDAVALQTYESARQALDRALADRNWVGALEETTDGASQPPAVILDLDETVLDNSPFQARVIRAGSTFDETTWKAWVAEGAAPAIPGALEFLTYARSRGVAPFYISNRDADEGPGTLANLRRLDVPLTPNADNVLLRYQRPEWQSDKSTRRAHVAATHRVLLVLGDDLNDFANAREASHAERERIIGANEAWWGNRWFMLPNPMYGSWENAAIGRGATPCERVERKIETLRER